MQSVLLMLARFTEDKDAKLLREDISNALMITHRGLDESERSRS